VIPATYGDDDATTAGVTLSVLLTLDAAGYTDYPDLVQGAAIAAK
jgi:hypothetical protein